MPQKLSLVMLAVAAAACSKGDATPTTPPPAEVGVMTVEPRTLPLNYEFVGEVQPIKRVEVRARVEGVIEARPFTEGSVVKAGQVLYRLERVRYDAAYRSAAARLANAKRTLARLEPLLAAMPSPSRTWTMPGPKWNRPRPPTTMHGRIGRTRWCGRRSAVGSAAPSWRSAPASPGPPTC